MIAYNYLEGTIRVSEDDPLAMDILNQYVGLSLTTKHSLQSWTITFLTNE